MSGFGRGRGWLKLDTNTLHDKPGGTPSLSLNKQTIQSSDEPLKSFSLHATASNGSSQIKHKCENLVSMINKLDNNDDGIQFNNKLKGIQLYFEEECHSENEVNICLDFIFEKCLNDEVIAIKFVKMVAAISFATFTAHGVKIRGIFINKLQQSFDEASNLLITSPLIFRNAFRMLNGFYHFARHRSGEIIDCLAKFVVLYFKVLLKSNNELDFELFTSQLYFNGAQLTQSCSKAVYKLSLDIRLTLANEQNLSSKCRNWLLLALDIINHRYSLLPSRLSKHYQEILGEAAMVKFQNIQYPLSIETSQSVQTFENFQSNVNILQVTPPECTSPIIDKVSEQTNNVHNQYPGTVTNNSTRAVYYERYYDSIYSHQDLVNNLIGVENEFCNNKPLNQQEKAGRPILGVGARLQRFRVGDDSNAATKTYQSKHNALESSTVTDCSTLEDSNHWNSKQKFVSNGRNKGWEHDDRFDKHY